LTIWPKAYGNKIAGKNEHGFPRIAVVRRLFYRFVYLGICIPFAFGGESYLAMKPILGTPCDCAHTLVEPRVLLRGAYRGDAKKYPPAKQRPCRKGLAGAKDNE
jgi:hypothetical protein